MSLTDQADLAALTGFIGRVQIAMAAAGVAIGNSTLDPNNTLEVLRHGLATKVLQDSNTWAPQFARAVAAELTYVPGTPIEDTDISNTVSAVWNAMAGASPAP